MSENKKINSYLFNAAAGLWNNLAARRAFWWVVFFAVSYAFLAVNFLPDQVALKAGEVARNDIYYEGGVFTYTSEIKTADAKTREAQTVPKIFKVDPLVLSNILEGVDQTFQNILAIKNDASLKTQEEKTDKIQELLPELKNGDSTSSLLATDDLAIKIYQEEIKRIIDNRMEMGVTEDQLSEIRNQIESDITNLDYTSQQINLMADIFNNITLVANNVYDPEATGRALEEALAQVKPIKITIQPGEKLIEKGKIVTKEQIEALQFLGLQKNTAPFMVYIGLLGFTASIYVMIYVFLSVYWPKFQKRETNIILLGILINFTLLVARAVTAINISDRPEFSAQLGYAIPMAAASMLAAILLDSRLAFFLTIVMGIFTGVITDGQMAYVVIAILSGLMGVYRVSHLSHRSHLVRASLDIALVSMIVIIFMGLMWNQSLYLIGIGALMGLINGVLSSILTIGLLPFMEGAFGITTVVKLLELSTPSHPLMKKLMVEAPGTYNHSILVGNLAEAAAEAIGADALLVRVGSYYHDIGKVKRPGFFIENQLGGENPHDKIAPTLSTLILVAHVKDGVELAKEYKFPQVLIDIIEQHHGTSLISYFYHKAKESGEKPETVLESDFRYPNIKPQTRESAIIMLADSVQAAVQVLERPTKGHLEAKVREIIRHKLDDGQFSECDLTFKDLDVIAQAFLRVLYGMFHSRIEYPDQMAKEIERGRNKNGTINKESTGQNPLQPGNGKNN